jgi:K+-sensing histidine kinase KdpD
VREDLEQMGVAVGGFLPLAIAPLLVPVRSHVVNTNIALVLMAAVVLGASIGGRAAGMLAAMNATLSFDFFFTRPYLSLTIDTVEDIETVVVLLVVGLFVGSFAGRHRGLLARDAPLDR